MSEPNISEALSGLSLENIRVDESGRVVLDAPGLADRLRELGISSQDLTAALRPSDTNVICCGNGTCPSRATELGSLVERMVARGGGT